MGLEVCYCKNSGLSTWLFLQGLISPCSQCPINPLLYTVFSTCSGEVYAIGGYNGVKTVDVVEKYNPEHGTWREVSPLVFGRSVPGIAVAYLWPVQSTMKSFWEPESQL